MNFNMLRRDVLKEIGYDDFVLLEPSYLDEAIIGMSHDNRVIYGYDELIQAFVKGENWTEEEAIEWIDYNVIRALPYEPNHPIINYSIKDYLD